MLSFPDFPVHGLPAYHHVNEGQKGGEARGRETLGEGREGEGRRVGLPFTHH